MVSIVEEVLVSMTSSEVLVCFLILPFFMTVSLVSVLWLRVVPAGCFAASLSLMETGWREEILES